MRNTFCLLVLLAASFATGQAVARKLDYAMPPTPAIADGLTFKVAAPVPADATPADAKPKRGLVAIVDPQYLDEARRMTYRQEFGGGGLATGLLLGPLGSAANAKAIQDANERESAALRGNVARACRDAFAGASLDAGARPDHRRDGYRKFCFPDGINAIFSHIRIAQEEALRDDHRRRARPYLDHVGVDLRSETDDVRAVFQGFIDVHQVPDGTHDDLS